MKRIKGNWRNGCFEKMSAHPVHTIPNHHPTDGCSPKTFVQISLLLNGKCGIQVHPPKNSDDLCFFYFQGCWGKAGGGVHHTTLIFNDQNENVKILNRSRLPGRNILISIWILRSKSVLVLAIFEEFRLILLLIKKRHHDSRYNGVFQLVHYNNVNL